MEQGNLSEDTVTLDRVALRVITRSRSVSTMCLVYLEKKVSSYVVSNFCQECKVPSEDKRSVL